jgi:hypothetical protein
MQITLFAADILHQSLVGSVVRRASMVINRYSPFMKFWALTYSKGSLQPIHKLSIRLSFDDSIQFRNKTCKTMLTQYNNNKVIPNHAIRAYSGRSNTAPFILTAAQD